MNCKQISIICPTYNEEQYIAKCIDSIIDQDIDSSKIELLLVDGMSTDKTRSIVFDYIKEYSWIKLLDNPERIVPVAMNRGIKEATGDIIIRIDAHTHYANSYISSLVNTLERYNATNVGAVCYTDVLNKNNKTNAIKEVLSHPLGVGNSLFRTGVNEVTEVDTVPFGCYRREVFEKYGLYNTKLIRNQDIELNKRIIREGGKILLIPDTYCVYMARETFREIAKNNYENGLWNILTVYYTKAFDSLSLRHFIPLLFVLSLIIPTLFAIIWKPFICISAISLLLYTILVIYISIKATVTKKINPLYMVISFLTLHISYGIGSLIGIKRIIFKQV